MIQLRKLELSRENLKQYAAEIIIIAAALVLLVTFFLPWITVAFEDEFVLLGPGQFDYTYIYEDYTGLQIANDVEENDQMLFGLLITAVLALGVTVGYYNHWLERKESGVGYIALGMAATFILFLKYLGLTHLPPMFGDSADTKTYEPAFYLAAVASLTIMITGFIVNRVENRRMAEVKGDRRDSNVTHTHGVLFPKVGRKQFGMRISWIILVVFLWTGVVIHLFPFYYMMALSVTPAEETLSPTPVLIPEEPTLTAWKLVYQTTTDKQRGKLETSFLRRPFAVYFRNSLFMTLMTMGLSLPITAMAAYANSKLMRGRIKRFSFFFFIGTLMIPGVVTIIPSFLLARHFPFPTTEVPTMPGSDQEFPHVVLWNTPWAVIIPGVFNAFNFLLFKGFFDTIPNSIIQAARVDGGSEFNIFRRIILPMSVPVFAVTAWIQFGAVWEQYLWPLVVIQDGNKQPVTVAVAELVEKFTQSDVTSAEQAIADDPVVREMREAGLSWNGLMVLGILQAFPVFLMFIICREYLMKGIRVRGFK